MNDTLLAGQRVVNTRAAHQAQELTDLLTSRGAEVILYPTIAIVPPRDTEPFDQGLDDILAGRYDWLIFTSSNGVSAVAERLKALGHTRTGMADADVTVAAVGTATARAARDLLGLEAETVPEEHVAESLAAAIPLTGGERIFLPQSALARPLLRERLQEAGARVDAVVAYHTVLGQGGDPLPEYFWEGSVDAVTFTSASTVHNFMRRLKQENGSAGMLVDVVVACIGPVTAEAAWRHDLPVAIVPQEHTLPALVDALAAHIAQQKERIG